MPPTAHRNIGEATAQEAYRAYGDAVNWLNHLGRPMPTWADLPAQIQHAWHAAAAAAHTHASQNAATAKDKEGKGQ
jgi:hypothetical protein